ncbi:MAG: hypothetical protein ACUVXF_12520 [Desulfobaccales bacterium]
MQPRLTRILGAVAALILYAPRPGFAFEMLWETQGSYVHQMAHVVFAIAMVFLIYEIKGSELRGQPGFRSLFWACVLLIWWNLDAVVGHALDWTLTSPVILGQGLERRLLMDSWHAWAYYFTQISHFLLPVPAFYFFYRSLKRFNKESETTQP